MAESLKRWIVCNMKGDTTHEVVATFAHVTNAGALFFNVIDDPCGPAEVVRAFSPGYWSQMALVQRPSEEGGDADGT